MAELLLLFDVTAAAAELLLLLDGGCYGCCLAERVHASVARYFRARKALARSVQSGSADQWFSTSDSQWPPKG